MSKEEANEKKGSERSSVLSSRSLTLSKSLTRSLTSVDLKKSAQDLRDDSEVMPWSTIGVAVLVAALCGVCAFLFHMAVRFAGCFAGVNGCPDALLYDAISNKGELFGPSIFFIGFATLTGLMCSLLLYNTEAGRECIGGGGIGTKVAVAAGARINPWVVPCRFFFASLYMGGGNTLGTEGPVIHLSITLATNIVVMMGLDRKKFISIFAVIGASAGISAAFGVLISGFIYTIEELTRSLSRKLALALALASAVATFVKHLCEDLMHLFMHVEHSELVPHVHWEELTKDELYYLILLAVPIGILNGIAGYAFTRVAIRLKKFLNTKPEDQHWLHRRLMGNKKTHLPYAGLLTGILGTIAFTATGVNGVWGTNIDAISYVSKTEHGNWPGALLLFFCKLIAFTISTAAGGPGGMLVPSLVAGGFLGLAMGELVGGGYLFCCASAVLGMGACFSSVMCLPVTGIVIMYELTRADGLVLHGVVANFISTNVCCRLPHGSHSFVHDGLEKNETWKKLGKQDFIETDEQEKVAKIGAQVAEKEMMELLRETSRGMARFQERGPKVVRIVDTVTLRTTIHPPRGGVLIMVQTKKTMANGKVKLRNALPGSKQRKNEDAWTAAQRILVDDLPGLHEHVKIRRDLPLEFNNEHKVSPSYKDVLSEYQNTFVEANVSSSDPYVLARFGIFEDDVPAESTTPGSPQPGIGSAPKFEVPNDNGETVEYTWYDETQCAEINVPCGGLKVREEHKEEDKKKDDKKKDDKDKDKKKDDKDKDKKKDDKATNGNTENADLRMSIDSVPSSERLATKEQSKEVKECLQKALKGVEEFCMVSDESFEQMLKAMKVAPYKANEKVFTNGKTDFLYILVEGTGTRKVFNRKRSSLQCNSITSLTSTTSDPKSPQSPGGPGPSTPKKPPAPVEEEEVESRTLEPGAVVGDQAMLMDTPGNITVVTTTDCVFWKLSRSIFLKYVADSDKKKAQKIGLAVLENIPLLRQLPLAERQTLLNSLPVQRYSKDSYIVCQGDAIDDFFIVLEGHCLCTQMDDTEDTSDLEEYTAGMCFGGAKFDSASGGRRTASVVVQSKGCLVLRADRKAFSKILTSSMAALLKGGDEKDKKA